MINETDAGSRKRRPSAATSATRITRASARRTTTSNPTGFDWRRTKPSCSWATRMGQRREAACRLRSALILVAVVVVNKRSQFNRQNRPPTAGGAAAALRPGNNAAAAAVLVAESSEPLVPHRAAKRANDAEMVHHPFGCDLRGSESSSLLLVSS